MNFYGFYTGQSFNAYEYLGAHRAGSDGEKYFHLIYSFGGNTPDNAELILIPG